MREILFRAKTEPNCKDVMNGKIIKNPKWIYGYVDLGYMHDCKAPLISDEKGNKTYKCQYETIGQFTGLTDKNGKKIFEGDIVNTYNGTKTLKELEKISYKGISFIGVIKWNLTEARFYLEHLDGIKWHLKNDRFYEIIGNIHDNPELLEEQRNGKS